jgi:hypothetical protein
MCKQQLAHRNMTSSSDAGMVMLHQPLSMLAKAAVMCVSFCAESLVPYAEWYYCHVVQSAAALRWMYVVSCSSRSSGSSSSSSETGSLLTALKAVHE